MRARLAIAEDFEPTQYLLRRILEPHYDIVAIACDGRALLEAVEEHHPDIVLLDIAMPIMNGIAVARHLQETHPAVKVIIVSAHSEPVYIDEAFRSGAHGYVFKQLMHSELVGAIESVLAGDSYVPLNRVKS